ncbi:hypothetical protein BKA69DRAFT_1104379 [Paraphysoderma sedebokerense]|nr:hypothetical protein BKA69DRAFT_1104379 [Paraphysoderma sedebokerense]
MRDDFGQLIVRGILRKSTGLRKCGLCQTITVLERFSSLFEPMNIWPSQNGNIYIWIVIHFVSLWLLVFIIHSLYFR